VGAVILVVVSVAAISAVVLRHVVRVSARSMSAAVAEFILLPTAVVIDSGSAGTGTGSETELG
jgi:hypothetical protein